MKSKRSKKVFILNAFVGHMMISHIISGSWLPDTWEFKFLYLEATNSVEIGCSRFSKLIYNTYKNTVGSLWRTMAGK